MTNPPDAEIRPGFPDFMDLPWDIPLAEWPEYGVRLEDVPRGLSRHTVWFVSYDGVLYAFKELPAGLAQKEYAILRQLESLHLPAVLAVGHFRTQTAQGMASVLVTRYLANSLPYRYLFMGQMQRYRQSLLDAIAGLLVQLHLAGIYWGDCSLSNTLFRRDAGALRAYLVDVETAEMIDGFFSPALRFHDLQIMEANVTDDLLSLPGGRQAAAQPAALPVVEPGTHPADTGAYIRQRYQRLWQEITHEDIIHPDEAYRIQERIRALNDLGFSVGDVSLDSTPSGNQLRLRVMVTDRNFHHDQLYSLTGLDAEEMQARKLMNEIQEQRALLSDAGSRSVPLEVAAFHWLEHVYRPIAAQLEPLAGLHMPVLELYCQVLEHKWYLSERSQRDVGHQAATQDYLANFGAAHPGATEAGSRIEF
jgi:hypothetical protein